MKIRKQIRRLHEIVREDARERRAHRDELKHLLGRMRFKERSLLERLEAVPDQRSRDELQRKIDMLHAQRRKGILALRESAH